MPTSQEIYDKLISENILNSSGQITATLLNIDCSVKSKSVVGDIIENWLQIFLEHHNINFSKPQNSQDFPDFLLQNENETIHLEIKSFDGSKSPNFDIANFQAYCESLLESPQRLDSDYLIFAYDLDQNSGELKITDLWLKKVWEISTWSDTHTLKIQQKKGMIYNIRPCVWYSDRAQFTPFSSRRDFVDAIDGIIKIYGPVNHLKRANWRTSIEKNYMDATGQSL